MATLTDQQISRYAAEDTRPATFLERGVTVPFTTPLLLGSRVRPGQRHGLELAVPSPGGVRGFYVLPLRGLRDLCTPTLYDRLVVERIEQVPVITPEAILSITRAVANEGLLGRAAAAAADEADKALAAQNLLTNYHFLLLLIQQTERSGEYPLPPDRDLPANVQQRAKRAVARLSQETGIAAQTIVSALEGLTTAYISVGFRGDPTRARQQRELAELEVLAQEVAAWGEGAADSQQAGSAALIARSARLTLEAGRVLLDALIRLPEDVRALVHRWMRDEKGVLSEVTRLAWLLDGWSVMIGLWRLADQLGRDGAVREMAVMVPTMPQEVSRWTGEAEDEGYASAHRLRGRFVFRLEDWRTGRTLEVIARNEMIVKETV